VNLAPVTCHTHGVQGETLCHCGVATAKMLQAMADMEWFDVPATRPHFTEWLTDVPERFITPMICALIKGGLIEEETGPQRGYWTAYAITEAGRDLFLRLLPRMGHALDEICAEHLQHEFDPPA